MTTQTVTFRRPTFSLKKVLSPVTKFIGQVFDSIVEARRLQAAFETAKYLKEHNEDFKDVPYNEIVYSIMNNK